MDAAAESRVDWAGEYQDLLEFVYLAPVGLIKFRPDGRIDMANPTSAQFLMPLAADGDMANFYKIFAGVMPDLRCSIDRFEGSDGRIFENLSFSVPGTPLVLTLGINKINANTLMAVIKDVTRAMEH